MCAPKSERPYSSSAKNNTFYLEKHPQATAIRLNKRIVEQAVLSPDALVEMGEDSCFIREIKTIPESPSGGFPPVQSQRAGDGTVLAPLSMIGVPSLEVTSTTSSDKNMYPLTQPVISVGQGSGNDIVISNPIVSRQHIQIIKQGNQLKLIYPHPSRQKTLNGLIYQGRKIRGTSSSARS
jgi:FHA domain